MMHILDHQSKKIIGFIGKKDLLRAEATRDWDLTESLEFEGDMLSPKAALISGKRRVVVPDEREGQYREFIIDEVDKIRSEGVYTAICSPSFYEIKKTKVIEPQTLTGQTCKTAANTILANTGWKVGQVDSYNIRTITFDKHLNPLDAVKQIASDFEVEIQFRIAVDGNVVIRYVDFLERIGTIIPGELQFGKDITEIVRKEVNDVVTSLYCIGPEKSDGTQDTVIVEDDDALQRWGVEDANGNKQHLIEIYEPQSSDQDMTWAQLRRYGELELKKRINAVVDYEMTAQFLEGIKGFGGKRAYFGDTIKAKDLEFVPSLYLEARIKKTTRDLLDEDEKDLTLGDITEYSREEITEEIENLKKRFFRPIYSATPPVGAYNILWVDISGNVPIYRTWNGTEWVDPGVTGDKIDGTAFLEDLETTVVTKYSREDKEFWVSQIKQPGYPPENEPDDSSAGNGWGVPLRTLSEGVRRINKQYDGVAIIRLPYNGDFAENLVIENISGNGKIIITGESDTYRTKFSGRIEIKGCNIQIEIRYINFFAGDDVGSYEGVVHAYDSPKKVHVNNCNFQGNIDTSFGVCAQDNSYVVTENCVFNEINRGTASLYGSKAINRNNTGRPRKSGVFANAGDVYLEGTMPQGIEFPEGGDAVNGGNIFGTKKIVEGTVTPVTPPTATKDIITTWTSSGGDSWRENFSGSWVAGEVVQGKWNNTWGIYRGLWYMPSTMSSTVNGKTIKKIRVYAKRLKGSGNGDRVPIYIRPHTYSSRPSGQPQYQNTWTRVDLLPNEERWVTLNSDFYTFFRNGTAKGLGVWYESGANATYAKLSTKITIEITYQ
jgi:phage minor structural protein